MIEMLCQQCGIAFKTRSAWVKKGGGKFCSVECHNLSQTGDGVSIHNDGYILIKDASHHRSNLRGYVYEHILVMEEKIGRDLFPSEEIHHINGITNDNSPDNLMLFENRTEHQKYHAKERLISKGIDPDKEKQCPRCNRILLKSHFSPSSSRGKATLSSHCKECCKEEQKQRRDKLKAEVIASMKDGGRYYGSRKAYLERSF